MNNEFIYGLIGGGMGITISYPIDTFKVLRQTNTKILLSKLYAGYTSPLIGMLLEKSVLFWSYDLIQSNFKLNSFNSGLLAGISVTSIVTPFERVKIRCQTSGYSTGITLSHIVKKDGILSLYRGWTSTLLREVPGYGVYFLSYYKIRNYISQYSNYNLVTAVASGACAGMSAWAVIYPSDPIKTISQNNNIGIGESIRYIMKHDGFSGFYKGFTPAILRAGVLHSGVFLGYEWSKGVLNGKKISY
jgi:solute carrier family 25 carnitine/acylcarnitine transporter 20/29